MASRPAGDNDGMHPFPAIAIAQKPWRIRLAWAMLAVFPFLVLSGTSATSGWVEVTLGIAGAAGLLGCLMCALAAGNLRVTLDDSGLVYDGTVRSIVAPLTEISWVGWLMVPPTAASPTVYILACKVRGRRLPVCSQWASSRLLGNLNGLPEEDVRRQLELAVNDRGIVYRRRIPDVSPLALSWMIAAVVLIAALSPLLFIHPAARH